MEQLQSALGTLHLRDFVKSAITAAATGIVMALGGIFTAPGFDIFAVDWHATINLCINADIAAFAADIVRRLSTDENGKLFGKI